MTTDATTLLFGKYHREILGLLLLCPDRCFHVRELERITGFPAGTLNRQLKRLCNAGLLVSRRSGNRVTYQANVSHPLFDELKNLFRKMPGNGMRLVRAAAAPVCRRHNVKRLSLFGSVARGTETASSDLDFMVEFEKGEAPTLAGLAALKEDLEANCGRRVDLATRSILENPHRRKSIGKDMEVIYERKRSRVPVGHARVRA